MSVLLSVICPAFNEEEYIEDLLRFFESAPPVEKELFIIDGGSTDKTRELVQNWQQTHPNIHLLDNPHRYVPHALNLAIRQCRGRYIARLDAHTYYPEDYFLNCLAVSQETGADNVGGYIFSAGEGPMGEAIAYAMSSPFGVGNSSFRTRVHDGYVDTVPFGFWPREVFEKYGLFDEALIRNQDDEFNYRTIKKGGKVYQSSRITSRYIVRSSLRSLYRQYYQYGLYKPLVIRKIGQVVKLRHLVPAGFVLYLFSLPLAIVFPYWLIPLLLYVLAAGFFCIKSKLPLAGQFRLMAAYLTLHVSYGLGFLRGLMR